MAEAQLEIVRKWPTLKHCTSAQASIYCKNAILHALSFELRCYRSGSENRLMETDSIVSPAETTSQLFLDEYCYDDRDREVAKMLMQRETLWDIAKTLNMDFLTVQRIKKDLQERYRRENP